MPKISIIDPSKFVVKSNDLVEARYRLSLQESHMVLWLLTQIRPEDEDFKMHSLKISDFAKMCGVEVDGKYKELRKITMGLIQRGLSIYNPQTKEWLQVSWLSSALYKTKQGVVLLEFSPKLKPYLLQLKTQFTKINIADAMGFKSIYALRIFELLVQVEKIGYRKMSVSELREWCGIGKDEYELYKDLKKRALNRAKIEINTKTKYEIDFIEIKTLRKVTDLEWTIKHKAHFEKSQSEKATVLAKELRSTSAILEQLLEYGFTKQAANRLVKNHNEANIVTAIKAVEVYMIKHAVKNPRALVETAIKEKWHPEKYATKKKAVKLLT